METDGGAQMEVASDWAWLSLRRILGFGGCVRGGKPSTKKTTNARMDDVQMGVASGWVGLSLRRVVGFGGGFVRESRPRLKRLAVLEGVSQFLAPTAIQLLFAHRLDRHFTREKRILPFTCANALICPA